MLRSFSWLPSSRFVTFKRDCMSVMRPDKNTCCVKLSLSLTAPLLDAAKNADKRASRNGTAHGSAR